MDLASPYDRVRETVAALARVGDRAGDDSDLRVRKHALAITIVGLLPATLLWVGIGLWLDRPLLALSSLAFAVALVVGFVVLARHKAFTPIVRGLLVSGMAYVFAGHVALGGMVAGGASLAWGLVAPVSAVLFFDGRRSLNWFGAYAAMVIAAVVLDGPITAGIAAEWDVTPTWLLAYNLLGPALVVLFLLRYVNSQRLDSQQQANALLHDVLPASVAARLARGERMIAETHPAATVLFADVVGFTGLAASAQPRDLLLILNQLFSTFDRLAVLHGVEKIKTSGDAYIAAAGAGTPHHDHARAVVEMAVEMHRSVARLGGLRRRAIRLRIGVASGPVSAGVVGERRLVYDIWGDTVNLASRMESTGVPGMVQVAPSTRARLGDAFPLERRALSVKGKGSMAAYLIDPAAAARVGRHRSAAAAPEAAQPAQSVDPVAEPKPAAV